MKENIFRATLTVLLAAAAAYFRKLLGPLIVMAIVMAADYITGIGAAWVAGKLSSRAGIIGIVKKLGYLVAVGVAIVVDYIIQSAAIGAGADLSGFYAFGLLVTVWLILNECISILENLSEIGVPLPPFLLAIIKKLKKTTEKAGDDQAKPAPEDLPEYSAEDLAALADEDPYAELMEPEDLARADVDSLDPPDA